MDLIAQLNSLGIDVRCKFPNINNGGCAVFASIVGKKLRDMKVTVRAVVMHYDCGVTQTPHIDKAREKIKNTGKKKNWNSQGIYFNHVGLEFFWKRKKYLFDSDGCIRFTKKFNEYVILSGRLTIEECEKLAKEPRGWNSCFNRRTIPAIRKMVNVHFSEMSTQNKS